MIRGARYDLGQKRRWDDFVGRAKNGHFLFFRDYMEYHADRFADASLLFYEGDKLVALLPANRRDETLVSHGGLTFGGVVSDHRMSISTMLELFAVLREELSSQGIARLVYKAIPHIYHTLPAEEDLYALFRHGAALVRRDVSSTIFLAERPAFSKGRKSTIKGGKARGLRVARSDDFARFMAIEEHVLGTRYGLRPVHTAAEIGLLAGRFPGQIKLFAAYGWDDGETMEAGVIIYEHAHVAHAQYISASDRGKEIGAADVILDFLINEYYADKRFFDFGISTEQAGQYLNQGLVRNKESFGARTVVYDFYELDLAR